MRLMPWRNAFRDVQALLNQYGVLFHSAMPTNLYGPGDNYHSENAHVLPAMIRRFYEAKEAGIKEVTLGEVVNLALN